ncbi:hypothetical protein Nepgr_025088 [Nepenthes gracilis]|uniref:Uncharacterized protein n=1 Tax=Nepenthes gracilis TaxID=150966 RepID=A0AAD3T565_NEPGR|nr:hypothetical protein Nepgr_025088 [Nepenthes gracilis]
MGRSRIGGQPPGESDVHRPADLVVDNRSDLVKVVAAPVVGQRTYHDACGPIYDVFVANVHQAGHVDWPRSSSAYETLISKPLEYLFNRCFYLYREFATDRSRPVSPSFPSSLSTSEKFGLRAQPGGFYEEGSAKEARGLVEEGGKGRQRGESERPFLVPPELGGACEEGVPQRNKGMKGRFALDALYPLHNDGSFVHWRKSFVEPHGSAHCPSVSNPNMTDTKMANWSATNPLVMSWLVNAIEPTIATSLMFMASAK